MLEFFSANSPTGVIFYVIIFIFDYCRENEPLMRSFEPVIAA
ncbi:hypothetical protein [Alkalihalobacterium alkalinitrilicum]|nr:hypothetical protein [Alkalihalobacterium alkalinitrilicum]